VKPAPVPGNPETLHELRRIERIAARINHGWWKFDGCSAVRECAFISVFVRVHPRDPRFHEFSLPAAFHAGSARRTTNALARAAVVNIIGKSPERM
jgi:hypothetical protein